MADGAQAYDPRITPARADIAAKHLEGKVEATRFVEGALREIVVAQAPLRREPRPDASLDTEALKGERVTVYDANEEGWSWGQLVSDGYVGWLPTDALGPLGSDTTHRVAVMRTLVFPAPSIKIPPIDTLSLGCQLAIARIEPPFAVTARNEFLPLRHLVEVSNHERDIVAVAERFLGVPYLWGGKTSSGLDCSALVQLSLSACGISCPRDSDIQEQAIGSPIAPGNALSNLRRGDLLFWKGHVAMARDNETMIHANAHHMAVAIEPIAEAVARIRAAGSEITNVRRIAAIVQ
jgi:Bacterial dipeptidyl-peptidase Sh3 domain/NlpC/P60 family